MRLHQALAVAMLGLLALWTVQSRPSLASASAVWLFALALGGWSLRRARHDISLSSGRLQWNGRMWMLRCTSTNRSVLPVSVTVVWDLQQVILLRLRSAAGDGRWVCAVRTADVPGWPALRRALMQDGQARVMGALRGSHG